MSVPLPRRNCIGGLIIYYLTLLSSIQLLTLSVVDTKRGPFVPKDFVKCPWKTPVASSKNGNLQGRKELIFDPIANLSKFLVPHDLKFRTSPKSAAAICRDAGLDPAQIDTIEGYQSVFNFFLEEKEIDKERGVAFHVKTLNRTDLVFLEESQSTNKTKDIRFQAFELAKGAYLEAGKDCLGLACKLDKCTYRNYPCGDVGAKPPIPADMQVLPLCQFDQKTAECYGVNMFSWVLHGDNQKFFALGQTTERELYGSNVPRWFGRAADICRDKGMKLLSFRKNDASESAEVLELLKCYREKINLPKYLAPSWTSGRFPAAYKKGESFRWVGTEKTWSYEDNKGHFNWYTGNIKFPSVEKCLVVASIEDKLVRPIACSMRNFFVCTKDREYSGDHMENKCAPPQKSEDNHISQSGRRIEDGRRFVALDYLDSAETISNKDKAKNESAWLKILNNTARQVTKPPRKIITSLKKTLGSKSSMVIRTDTADRTCHQIDYNGTQCSCRLAGCDFNPVSQECTEIQKECEGKVKCGRGNTFIAFNQEICYNAYHTPCFISKNIVALNLNGSNHKASNGRFYKSDRNQTIQPYLILRNGSIPKKCPTVEGIRPKDAPLFERTAHSYFRVLWKKEVMIEPCLSYSIPVKEDGLYELSILMAELTYTEAGMRLFDVKLNNLTVAKNLDIVGLTGSRCHAADLVVHFEVNLSRKKLTWSGIPEPFNSKGPRVKLKFCLGECFEAKSIAFQVAAFSVVKLDPDKPSTASAEVGKVLAATHKPTIKPRLTSQKPSNKATRPPLTSRTTSHPKSNMSSTRKTSRPTSLSLTTSRPSLSSLKTTRPTLSSLTTSRPLLSSRKTTRPSLSNRTTSRRVLSLTTIQPSLSTSSLTTSLSPTTKLTTSRTTRPRKTARPPVTSPPPKSKPTTKFPPTIASTTIRTTRTHKTAHPPLTSTASTTVATTQTTPTEPIRKKSNKYMLGAREQWPGGK